MYESLQVRLQFCVLLWVFVGLCAWDLGGFDDCNFVIFMQQSKYIRVCIWCFFSDVLCVPCSECFFGSLPGFLDD